jgi:hypothetical protein
VEVAWIAGEGALRKVRDDAIERAATLQRAIARGNKKKTT